MIKSGEFAKINVESAGDDLSVTLRKRGIHRGAVVQTEIMPKLTADEIDELQEQGHIEPDTPIVQYDRSSVVEIDKADELSAEQVDAALAIAETLAASREVETAKVNIMGTYMFDDFRDYLQSTVLLVRKPE